MVTAIALAGGTGARVGAGIPKQFVSVMGKPILAYTLGIFQENRNIDSIEIVCHPEWLVEARRIAKENGISKVRWICEGGESFQDSVCNGVFNLEGELAADDIAVVTFGAAPMTPQEDIDDSIRVCRLHGNGIASADINLCTCIKDDEESSTQSIVRETLKAFANPWAFRFGELLEAYKIAVDRGMLAYIEPHTTSLYLALGKRLWFSQSTSPQAKITHKYDIDHFEGQLLLERWREGKLELRPSSAERA